ncbi:MAG: methyltransferase domain-containing protein [Desulfuromonadales bacterium]|nr:methyltransferase domain-containing protein [Desulfuromonadales bacterium]
MVAVKAIDRQRMRGNFSSHAGEYDLYAQVQKRVVARLSDSLTLDEVSAGPILDIGTGTGALAQSITNSHAGSNLPGSILLMDIAHGMTCEAHRRLPQALACDGDARSLPFSANSFPLVMSSSVYQWVERLDQAFAEVLRILQPGGRFAVALFGEQTLFELRSSHRQAIARCGSARPSHVQSFPSGDEVSQALSSAGFRGSEVASFMEQEYHADVPTLLRNLKHIGASNASSDQPRGLASRRVMQQMISLYEQNYRSEHGITASYQVIIATAQKKP